MQQVIEKLSLETTGKQIINITQKISNKLDKLDLKNGLLNLTVLHTSSSLMIQENADPSVLKDISNYLEKIVPEEADYLHDSEGPDDMPAHIKSLLTNTQLTLSVIDGIIKLGSWQGIFFLEHRTVGRKREVLFHFIGD